MCCVSHVHANETYSAPRQYRGSQPVLAAPDGTLFCEAEEFRVVSPGWQAGRWGENYYAATFANTFLSRKGFLGAPENGGESVAVIDVEVPEPGRYLVLVRYEAAYRFETQFKVRVEQQGQVKLDRLYGARKNIKIWAFGSKLKDEVAWPWGAVENIVWEGHDVFVNLQPGKATISLIASPQPGPQARRNVDLLMLTRDETQVKTRIEKEQYLPLDGMLTQAGDVYLKVHNAGNAPVAVKSLKFPGGPMQQHSPYWTHLRNWQPIAVDVAAGSSTKWIDVGGTMDTLNDGQWGFHASGPCRIEFGVKRAGGQIASTRTFAADGNLPLISRADARYGGKLQMPAEATQELFAYVQAQPAHGKKITRTRVQAQGALPAAFYEFYGFNQAVDGVGGYADCRSLSLTQIQEKYGEKLSDAERRAILIMSLGDEIGLPSPNAAKANEGFQQFLKSHGVTRNQLALEAGGDASKVVYRVEPELRETAPQLYYWSKRYQHHFGIQAIKQRTDLLRRLLPNAFIGANFSPHHGGAEHAYLGETHKWIGSFREEAMTLPWSEDYAWQVPIGTQQMNGINLDLLRAGLRGKPHHEILYYVMPHTPGNTPNMWRRLYHNALARGMTILNLFEFDPVYLAYTENHTSDWKMYATVYKTLRELGLYEDIIQDGRVRDAQSGLWFSETADIWRDNQHSFAAGKRGLYVGVLHQQVPLDFLVDQDAIDGTLQRYKVLYLTDNHVSSASSRRIADWVRGGGTLFATAGAGMWNEFNEPNRVLRELMGIREVSLDIPPDDQVGFMKEDLPFAKVIDSVTWQDGDTAHAIPVVGVRSHVELNGARVTGTFRDGTPAVAVRDVGKGKVTWCGFLPGLSYFQPAIPRRPIDRGSTDDAMAHFIPTAFDPGSDRLIGSVLPGPLRSAVASERQVTSRVIASPGGVAVVLENWTGNAIESMTLTMPGETSTKAALASGVKLDIQRQEGGMVFTFDMDVSGDVLIVR